MEVLPKTIERRNLEFKKSDLVSDEIQREMLEKLGTSLFKIEFTEEENLMNKGWREGIEKYGQELWQIYNWIVSVQDGKTHGIYRLRDWLISFNIPDNTDGAHWPKENEY